jgi:hypothetical protein
VDALAEDLRVTAGPEAAAAFRAAHAPAPASAPASAGEPADELAVHPDNVTAARLFLAAGTQWRRTAMAGMGGAAVWREGLDYTGVEAAARLAGLTVTPDDFEALRLIELEVLAADARRARRGAGRPSGKSSGKSSSTGRRQ